MAVSKRAALGTGFGVMTSLLVLSTVLAYHIQDSFSERSVAIHRSYVQELEIITDLRRLLYNAGISVRDYLINPAPDRIVTYRKQLRELKQEGEPLLGQLRRSDLNRADVNELEKHIGDLWEAMEVNATHTGDSLRTYQFVQLEIAPRRLAAGEILRELETAKRSAMTQSEEEFSASRSAAASKLLWLLACCVLGGIVIAWFSLRYSDHLEREAAARFDEVLDAKLELERLSNRLMEIQEEERTKLSRELHDEIVQNVAVLKIEITHALASLHSSPAKEPLTRARELADRTVLELRNISLLLRPSLLDDLGLGPALQWLTDDFSKRTGVPCQYVEEDLLDDLPGPIKTCVYRVTQEALRNCEKHSKAQSVSVRVVQTFDGLQVEIRDDGVGFRNGVRSPVSLGVLGMRERAIALAGDLSIDSSTGLGTSVRLWLPHTGTVEQSTPLEAHV